MNERTKVLKKFLLHKQDHKSQTQHFYSNQIIDVFWPMETCLNTTYFQFVISRTCESFLWCLSVIIKINIKIFKAILTVCKSTEYTSLRNQFCKALLGLGLSAPLMYLPPFFSGTFSTLAFQFLKNIAACLPLKKLWPGNILSSCTNLVIWNINHHFDQNLCTV